MRTWHTDRTKQDELMAQIKQKEENLNLICSDQESQKANLEKRRAVLEVELQGIEAGSCIEEDRATKEQMMEDIIRQQRELAETTQSMEAERQEMQRKQQELEAQMLVLADHRKAQEEHLECLRLKELELDEQRSNMGAETSLASQKQTELLRQLQALQAER